MSWTYSGDPASSSRDAARFLAGDTLTTDQLAQDAEFDWAILQQPNVYLAAALVLDALAARYARDVDKRIGSLSVSASQRAAAFRARAAELRADPGALGTAEVFVGGISQTGKQTLDSNTDAVQPSFRIGQDDDPRNMSERARRTDGTWWPP